MVYLTIPEFVYIVLLYGGTALLVVSVLMGIRGMIKSVESDIL